MSVADADSTPANVAWSALCQNRQNQHLTLVAPPSVSVNVSQVRWIIKPGFNVGNVNDMYLLLGTLLPKVKQIVPETLGHHSPAMSTRKNVALPTRRQKSPGIGR
jgi:hypothetical protein